MADIYFENITKSFDGKTILKNINLHIKDKELFTFWGLRDVEKQLCLEYWQDLKA